MPCLSVTEIILNPPASPPGLTFARADAIMSSIQTGMRGNSSVAGSQRAAGGCEAVNGARRRPSPPGKKSHASRRKWRGGGRRYRH